MCGQLCGCRACGQSWGSTSRDLVVLSRPSVSLRWQRLNGRPWGLNCLRWSDGRWYSVCHVGPNDMRWTWWSPSPNHQKEQAVSARAAAETLSVDRGPHQRHTTARLPHPSRITKHRAVHVQIDILLLHDMYNTAASLILLWSKYMGIPSAHQASSSSLCVRSFILCDFSATCS